MERKFNTGTLIVDNNEIVVSSNHYISHITDKNPNSIYGKHISDIFDLEKECLIKRNGELINVFFEISEVYVDDNSHKLYIFWGYDLEIQNHPILSSIIKSSFDVVFITDSNTPPKIVYASPSSETFGYGLHHFKGENFVNFIEKKYVKDFYDGFSKVINDKQIKSIEVLWKSTESFVPADIKISPILGNNGEVTMLSLAVKIIDIENQSFEESSVDRQYLKSLFDNNPDMVFSLNTTFTFKDANESMYKNTGFNTDELMGKPFSTLIHHDDFKKVFQALLEIKNGKIKVPSGGKNYEINMINKKSEKIPVQLIVFPIKIHGEMDGIYGIAKNISNEKKNRDTIQRLAYFDPLTELPNRSNFQTKLSSYNYLDSYKQGFQKPDRIAILFFDLDNFKGINDNLGHNAGDKLLRLVSERISLALPDNCFFSRMSGDEFTIIVDNFSNKLNLTKIANIIKKQFLTPFNLEGNEILISSSIGIALHPDNAKNAEDLIRFADIAMYVSKQSGRNYFSFYNDSMFKETNDDFKINGSLQNAFKNEEFQLYYQPIVCSSTNNLIAAEALIRWQHPTEGVISPGLFIPLAEVSGAIQDIGEWVITSACKQIKEWIVRGLPVTPISVNVSGKQLERSNFYSIVEKNLKKYEIIPKNLIIEITETIALQGDKTVMENLINIKKLGCLLAIDDFGAGHSSLTYLKDFPVHFLKMDNSFTKNISQDEKLVKIVKTIISLGHQLGLQVVAEGVENIKELNTLKNIGTDFMQGYFFSRPIKAIDFEYEFLLNHKK